jgi:hypothetical protein
VHVTWKVGTDITMRYHSAADRCFARCFDTDEEWDTFCKKLKQNPIDGLCDCMGNMEYILRLLQAVNRIHRCHLYPPPSVETMNKPKWERWELESDGLFSGRCPISSTARVLGGGFD